MCPLQALVPGRLGFLVVPHRGYECIYFYFMGSDVGDPEGNIILRFYEQILPCSQSVSLFLFVELESFSLLLIWFLSHQ